MNDTLIQDSLKVANNVLEQHSEFDKSFNLWMWIAILELGIIAFLLLKGRIRPKETAKQKFKNDSLKQTIDFNNIINKFFFVIFGVIFVIQEIFIIIGHYY